MAACKPEIESRRREESQIGRDDDWDDSALIAAYDKAMNKARVEVVKKKNTPYTAAKGDQKSKKKQKWNVGDYCQTTFSEDGLRYEAVIIEVDESNDCCTVQFLGYGNEEEVPLSSLTASLGRSNRLKQEEMAKTSEKNAEFDDAESSSYSEEENVRRKRGESTKTVFQDVQQQKDPVPYHRCFANRQSHHYNMTSYTACPPPPPPPPPMPTPPPFLLDRSGPEDDKLYSMLLSWYMSGYHTGFYMGSRQSQSSPSHLRNMYNYYNH